MTHDEDTISYDEAFYPEGDEYVSVYTRRQAIRDGVLIDVTETAKLFGFKHPVAFSDGAYVDLVIEYCRGTNTLEADRLNAVLLAIRDTIARKAKHPSDRIYFRLATCDGEGTHYDAALIAHCGPGDDPDPVITIMRPEDD